MSSAMIDLDNLIEQANGLAPLPASAVRLAGLIGDPDCHLDQVVELIAFDQALTLKLLRAANSAASASATRVGSVQEAVIRMGTAQVLAFTVAAGARPLLQPGIPEYGLSEGALWRHSVAAAVATEAMQLSGGFELPPETFTSALLHDVGKLVMGRFLTPEVLGFIRWSQEVDHLDRLEAESVLLEVNHAELGGLVAQHWKLPPRIVQGITYHHNPGAGVRPDLRLHPSGQPDCQAGRGQARRPEAGGGDRARRRRAPFPGAGEDRGARRARLLPLRPGEPPLQRRLRDGRHARHAQNLIHDTMHAIAPITEPQIQANIARAVADVFHTMLGRSVALLLPERAAAGAPQRFPGRR